MAAIKLIEIYLTFVCYECGHVSFAWSLFEEVTKALLRLIESSLLKKIHYIFIKLSEIVWELNSCITFTVGLITIMQGENDKESDDKHVFIWIFYLTDLIYSFMAFIQTALVV